MTEFLARTLTAAVMVLLALMAAVVGGYYFAIFVAAVATAMFYEWTRIVQGWGAGWSLAGFFYALVPALCLLWLRDRADDGLAIILWIFVITWATDIGGYVVGKAFGGRKLAPAISPGKTWAGLYGSVAAATLFGGLWAYWAELPAAPVLLILAPLFSLAGQAGDLFESGMKRRAGVKDSGDWLPGHGGLLDRLDGMVPIAVLTLIAEMAGVL